MSALSESIERFLLTQGGWVDSDALCLAFGCDARELRATGNTPGLCSTFAISGPRGFRHVCCATEEEWLTFRNRLHAHAAAENRRVFLLQSTRETPPQDHTESAIQSQLL